MDHTKRRRPPPSEIPTLKQQTTERPAGYRFLLPYGAHLWVSMPDDLDRWQEQALALLWEPMYEAYGMMLSPLYLMSYSGAVVLWDEKRENVIACALLRLLPDGNVECRNEAVIPRYQRQGVGTRLLKAIAEAAPLFVRSERTQNEAKTRELHAYIALEDADWQRPWLEKLGFELEGDEPDEMRFVKSFVNPLWRVSTFSKQYFSQNQKAS
jgi:GNAT superfamily N-acetyltransferase